MSSHTRAIQDFINPITIAKILYKVYNEKDELVQRSWSNCVTDDAVSEHSNLRSIPVDSQVTEDLRFYKSSALKAKRIEVYTVIDGEKKLYREVIL